MDLKEKIRTVPNWPIEGVMFRDITTLLQDPEAFRTACDRLYERYKNMEIDKIVAIDARGFVFGAVLSYKLNVGFVPVRKEGKLPYDTISESYTLEYGENVVEMHKDAIKKGENNPWETVSIVDLEKRLFLWEVPAVTIDAFWLRLEVYFGKKSTFASEPIGPYAIDSTPPRIVPEGNVFWASTSAHIPFKETASGPAKLKGVSVYAKLPDQEKWNCFLLQICSPVHG